MVAEYQKRILIIFMNPLSPLKAAKMSMGAIKTGLREPVMEWLT